jgi:putative ABC transport system permease protein
MGVEVGKPMDARALIREEQAKTERVGVFGTLSIGFLAAVAMAGMGLLLYSYASLRERLYSLTVLRAIGLNLRQVVIQVTMEYTVLTVCGATIGALVGVAASRFFAPFFTVTGEAGTPLPPLIPVIARQDVAYLVIAFVVAMVVLGVIVIARAFSRRHFDLLRAHWG